MAQFYYILNSDQYNEHSNNLEYAPLWNVDKTQCVIEVNENYTINNYMFMFQNSNIVQDYIYHPIRINEWYQPDESELV